jgi:broad specificity phosphatase PhoE
MFHFIRHGKTDYSERNVKIHQGFGVNPAGLSKEGIAQIKETAKRRKIIRCEYHSLLAYKSGTYGSHFIQGIGH